MQHVGGRISFECFQFMNCAKTAVSRLAPVTGLWKPRDLHSAVVVSPQQYVPATHQGSEVLDNQKYCLEQVDVSCIWRWLCMSYQQTEKMKGWQQHKVAGETRGDWL